MDLPNYRAEINIEELAKGNNIQDYLHRVVRHYVNRGTIIKIESEDYNTRDSYYAIGRLNSYDEIEVFDNEDKQILKFPYYKNNISIHFPDMLDGQGNKIFASLSEDGKGGDLVLIEAFREELQKGYCIYKNGRFSVVDIQEDIFDIPDANLEIKVIGIQ